MERSAAMSTSSAMETKRGLEYVSSQRIQPEARACKRARTEKFLEAAEEFNRVQQTCRFFDSELPAVNAEDDSTTSNGFDALIANVRNQMVQHEEQFRSQCEVLREDADEAIRIHDSFHSVAAGIESSTNEAKCFLPMLNQGPETNSVITGMIAAFAGVQSDSDIADWKELRTLLR